MEGVGYRHSWDLAESEYRGAGHQGEAEIGYVLCMWWHKFLCLYADRQGAGLLLILSIFEKYEMQINDIKWFI